MPRSLVVILLAILALATSLAAGPEPVCASGQCGILPIKPIPPIGCRDLTPVCVCDSQGHNCHWQWHCIR